MADSFINIVNVLDVAKFLSSVDRYSIKPEILEDSEDFILELKIALDNFNNPSNYRSPERQSHMFLFDKHLSELLNATKNLYNILTDEGKDTIKRFINHKNQMKNNAFPLSDN